MTLPWCSSHRENTWTPPPLPHPDIVARVSFWLLRCQKRWGYGGEAAGQAQSPSCTPVWASVLLAAVCSMAPPSACWRRLASGIPGSILFWSAEVHAQASWRNEGAATPTQTGTQKHDSHTATQDSVQLGWSLQNINLIYFPSWQYFPHFTWCLKPCLFSVWFNSIYIDNSATRCFILYGKDSPPSKH